MPTIIKNEKSNAVNANAIIDIVHGYYSARKNILEEHTKHLAHEIKKLADAGCFSTNEDSLLWIVLYGGANIEDYICYAMMQCTADDYLKQNCLLTPKYVLKTVSANFELEKRRRLVSKL